MSVVRNAIALVLIVLAVLFVALNWKPLTEVRELSLGVSRFNAPLGLAMLVVVGVLALIFLIYSLTMRTSSLVESRRFSRELEAARKLADEAEASRVADLHALVETGLASLRELVSSEAVQTREHIDRSEVTLQAYLGEIDDYLKSDQASSTQAGPPPQAS